MRASKSFAVLLALSASLYVGVASADPIPSRIAIGRVRLECLLHDRQNARTAILDEQQRTQAHLAKIEVFRGKLVPSTNAAAIGVADQAIARDRSALTRIARRLAMADQAITATQGAIANLVPPPPPPSLVDQAIRAGNVSLANAMHCGEVPDETSPVSDLSLAARLFAGDFCGSRTDAHYETKFGLSNDHPALTARLERILARLNAVSPSTPVRLLRGCHTEVGGGAFSTSTTSYIGECFLSADHSDDEIAFIVAHERAHVTMQHVSLTYIAKALERRRLTPFTANADVISAAMAANLGDYGRVQENEADVAGAVAAMSAGFSPRGIHEFLSSAKRDEPEVQSGAKGILQQMSADHPSSDERGLALRAVFGDDFMEADPASGRCLPAAR